MSFQSVVNVTTGLSNDIQIDLFNFNSIENFCYYCTIRFYALISLHHFNINIIFFCLEIRLYYNIIFRTAAVV